MMQIWMAWALAFFLCIAAPAQAMSASKALANPLATKLDTHYFPINHTDPSGLLDKDTEIPAGYQRVIVKENGEEGDHFQPGHTYGWWKCSGKYNCHAYSLTNKEADSSPDPFEVEWAKNNNFDMRHSYNIDPLDDLNEQNYRKLGQDEPNQAGDIVIFGKDVDGNGVINYLPRGNKYNAVSEAEHSGVVQQVDASGNTLMVRSKLGSGHLQDWHPRDLSKAYGATREYYRKR